MAAMLKVLTGLHPRVRQFIRIGYVIVLVVLVAYAWMLQRQLRGLRERPVALPAYAFYVVDRPEKASVIQAMGSWVATGASPKNAVQTTSIECKRAKMQCVESISVVAVEERAYLESMPVVYDVAQWDDDELATKPASTSCSDRIIHINFEQRKADLRAAASPLAKQCAEPQGSFLLESGAALLQRNHP